MLFSISNNFLFFPSGKKPDCASSIFQACWIVGMLASICKFEKKVHRSVLGSGTREADVIVQGTIRISDKTFLYNSLFKLHFSQAPGVWNKGNLI
jgi:hypothetical protein